MVFSYGYFHLKYNTLGQYRKVPVLHIDFVQVNEEHIAEEVAERLGLKRRKCQNQLRGECSACDVAGDRALAVTQATNVVPLKRVA